MLLHEDKEAFKEILEATAEEFNLQPFQVEKDYYVSYFLKKLREVAPNIVFKGGTSLSKCYNVINRFSEDIDLTIHFTEEKLTSSKIKSNQRPLIQSIRATAAELGFKIINDDEIRSGREFNAYKLEYDRIFNETGQMLDHILIETMLTYRPYPCDILKVSNYATKFLAIEDEELVVQYNLQPFEMNIQTIERTFIDKLFAVCDYYHTNESNGKSRHIYDIHMIYQSGLLNAVQKDLMNLVNQVIETRRLGRHTHSCTPGYPFKKILNEIIEKEYFKKDYDEVTSEFLADGVKYEIAICSLKEILIEPWIPDSIQDSVILNEAQASK